MTPYISYREIERIRSKKEQLGSNLRCTGKGKKASPACGADALSLRWSSDRGFSRNRSDSTKLQDKSVTVLVVDDDSDTRMLYCEILEEYGYRSLAVSDAVSALIAIENAPEVKLVITDNRMPDMSGLEFADILRKLRPGVPVILLTACPSVENYLLSRDLGVFEFVDKSAKKGEFARIVRSALDARNAE